MMTWVGLILICLGIVAYFVAPYGVGGETRMMQKLRKYHLAAPDDSYYVRQRRIVGVGVAALGLWLVVTNLL
jgi:hypothetical protein